MRFCNSSIFAIYHSTVRELPQKIDTPRKIEKYRRVGSRVESMLGHLRETV
jgi:hypothetical protein